MYSCTWQGPLVGGVCGQSWRGRGRTGWRVVFGAAWLGLALGRAWTSRLGTTEGLDLAFWHYLDSAGRVVAWGACLNRAS